MNKAHAKHRGAPQYPDRDLLIRIPKSPEWRQGSLHNDGDEYRRPKPLEEDVGQGLKDRIGYEEDGQGAGVLAAAQE